MKTTIIELLNKIANGEQPPNKITFREQEYEYDICERDYYYCNGAIYWLFDEYAISTILNDEVEILETTITMKELVDNSKINELTDKYKKWQKEAKQDKIKKLKEKTSDIRFAIQHLGIETVLSTYSSKINEIIDKVSKYD